MRDTHYDFSAPVPKKKLPDVIDALAELGITTFKVATRKKETARTKSAPVAVQVRNAILDAEDPKNIRSSDITARFPDLPKQAVYKAFSDLVKAKLIRSKSRGVYAVTGKATADG